MAQNPDPPDTIVVDPDVAVFMVSGGMDSTATLLSQLPHQRKPRCVYLNLGQKSGKRQEAAVKRIGLHLGVPVDVGNMEGMADLFLTSSEPPHPMVAEPGPNLGENSAKAVIIAASYAASLGSRVMYYGATADDVARSPFMLDLMTAIQNVVRLNANFPEFEIVCPLSDRRNSDIVSLVPLEIARLTWSCLWGGLHHCGECQGCTNRKERFADAGVADSTVYSQEFLA